MSRLLSTALSAGLLVFGGIAISYGGAHILLRETASTDIPLEPVDLSEIDLSEPDELAEPTTQLAQAEPSAPTTSQPPAAVLDAPESMLGEGYEREEPRAPLSDLYGKPTPKSEAKPVAGQEDWRTTRLFNPVAVAAGRIEVKGHKIALEGVEPLTVDEKCNWNGTDWYCGAAARTAFRNWMRSRAVQCKIPVEAGTEEIRAECHIGRSNMADWLISNGWARPEPGSPYEAAGNKAREAKLGIYGEPPRRVSLTIVPNPEMSDPSADVLGIDPTESTPDELNQDPAPGFTPPADGAAAFPPPPAEPQP